jgi:hypothetical protein
MTGGQDGLCQRIHSLERRPVILKGQEIQTPAKGMFIR